ncbi:hypothetical protein JCGZ_14080 [Jatropha curcas]|uniref:Uncharacterized protein n=1 Tax=Jatropha curcas TaxID=180498 RepID=A0A067K924_JATCU|nr:uncharacterized protein LOC110010442 [Jatropha curcas]KDP28309.1 hypothetical protein JCGZ_14080 [Jatropha curcas]
MEDSPSKRKLCLNDDQDEENEEVKIEKFFALIRSIREARESLMNADNNKKKKRKVEEEKLQASACELSFQPEDFLEESHKAKNPIVVSVGETSQRTEAPVKEATKEDLDLRLSL